MIRTTSPCSVILHEPPAYDLVRVIVRGTGPTPVFGADPRVPLAGLVDGPPGGEDDGHDAVFTLRVGRAASADDSGHAGDPADVGDHDVQEDEGDAS